MCDMESIVVLRPGVKFDQRRRHGEFGPRQDSDPRPKSLEMGIRRHEYGGPGAEFLV